MCPTLSSALLFGSPAKAKAAGKPKAGAQSAKGSPAKGKSSTKAAPAKAAPKGKKAAKAAEAQKAKESAEPKTARAGSKSEEVIAMLKRKGGATLAADYKCKGTPSLAGNVTLTLPACGIPVRFLP
jgi:hypothetical protein